MSVTNTFDIYPLLYQVNQQNQTVLRGENLVARDSDGLSDSYVNIQLVKITEGREKVIKSPIIKSLNPQWNFECLRM